MDDRYKVENKMMNFINNLADAYVQYLRACFNPYLIILGLVLIFVILGVGWFLRKGL